MAEQPLARNATVAVAGGKGGSGKTTATLGLALALVDRGRRPLVVDADCDVPDLHIRAGVEREPGLPALGDGTDPVAVSQRSDRFPGVAVLAAGTDRVRARNGLRVAAELPRPVLIDCPAGAGPDAADPLRVADTCIVASTNRRAGRADAAKTVEMARSVGAEPQVAVERSVETTESAAESSFDLPTVCVPDGGRRPLQDRSVRAAYRTVVRRLYDDTARCRETTATRRADSNAWEFGRNV